MDFVQRYLRYGWGLYRFLKEPLSLAQCYTMLRNRVENRNTNFLRVLQCVYSDPRDPYWKLLRSAGCELGDVKFMLGREGLEETLRKLSCAGVYITVEEYKGKKPVQRNGLSFQVNPKDFNNPLIAGTTASVERISSGTRSQGVRSHLGFDFLADLAAIQGVLFDDLGLHQVPCVFWHDFMTVSLSAAKIRTPVDHWFFPLSTNKNRLRACFASAVARALGCQLPWPRRASPKDAHKIACWLAEKKLTAPRRLFWTKSSLAVRVCLAARERALDISGAHFVTGAEPLTKAREEIIRASGCTVSATYTSSETGNIGRGCRNSTGDDVHLFKSHLAVIQQSRTVGSTGMTVDALRFTTLLPTAPKIFINVENGDYARLEKRSCGCKLDIVGLRDHLSHVRSFEKLTSEGMTFFAGDLVRIVEEVLPAKFGGNPLDYQAVEEERTDGLSQFTMLVSPKVGELDEEKLVQTVLEELRKGGANNLRMAGIWEEAGTVRVRREEPQPTKGGKVLPFQAR